MKKNILIIFLSLIIFASKGQVKTKITGCIPEYKENDADVEISVFYPHIIGNGRKVDYKTRTSRGHFEFELDIDEPLSVTGTLNEQEMIFPGAYSILVNPGDSIHVEIPNAKKLGIMNLKFSGIGSPKVHFQQAIVAQILSLYKQDPAYRLQSLSYQFASTDKKLNAIDSICTKYKGNFKTSEIDLIKAMEYETVLHMLMYSSMQSTNDSLKTLFKNYIVKKNRMKPFLTNHVIHNYGMTVLSDFVLLSEYDNPKNDGFRVNENPVEYCKLIIKYLSKYPAAKEYLLANTALNVFSDEQDSENSNIIYRLYSDNVDHGSTFYRKVLDSYQIIKSRLKKGMPFYSFSLPDTTGKIHELSDFKGKVVILDFWFNGCGGCRELAPVMVELEKEYIGKEIQFISISIDRDKSLWLKGIGKYCSKSSLQLFTEGLETKHPLVEFLNPGGFPFLIAIDKHGNLIGPPPDPRGGVSDFKRFIGKYL
ncbi:TlpA disulfide reductase family protein [Chryseobacterium gambrini]|uniref:TlpA disulfide reductase family protein n=1 Tax=Chryseobacterium gambrini TaxID=373672 RepID=A0AAJ1R1I6_9FLAO|nr:MULTISPECIES: TlpA disulfide reductase family protein [Chryseobacterium]MDN4011492.1 TlpA disulfide reductase family protein [Chryseobacterium gambrini]QWA38259.1 TlpA family protein disulfide reductase [Chryseobacterium sp. ZHDP1]